MLLQAQTFILVSSEESANICFLGAECRDWDQPAPQGQQTQTYT